MSARAIWQGELSVQKHRLSVKLFSAVVDRQTHFHLLHKRDHARVRQMMVNEETDETVAAPSIQKAFESEPGVYVLVTPEDIDRSAPKPGRAITVAQFVPTSAIEPQLFDRPYYLWPTEDSTTDYFALTRAIANKKVAGVASWVMRKHSYVGALVAQDNYLMLISLRHADEVIPVGQLDPPSGRALEPKERNLANQLIEALSGQFDAAAYRDTYQERIRELIDAKRRGKKIKKKRVVRRRTEGTLADSLQSSLKAVSAHRRA